MGLVWSGYMERMWNGAGQRVWPSIFRGRFRAFRACVVSHDFSFVSIKLHPCLFTPCLTCIYHHLEFESISRDQTQIVNVENSPCPPDFPIVGDSSIGELHLEFVNQISHKKLQTEKVGLNLLPSGNPCRMSTLLLLGIRGCRTRTLTM